MFDGVSPMDGIDMFGDIPPPLSSSNLKGLKEALKLAFESDPSRTHLSTWSTEWVRVAFDAWTEYEREADMREYGPAGKPPKMDRSGLPIHIQGFWDLFNHVADKHFERALNAGFTGTFDMWRREVKRQRQ